MTKPQAEMLATLAVAARPHGARHWDAPGVMAALANIRHLDLAEVMMAVGRAARDRTLETPAAIGNTAAPCWIERPVERWTPTKTTRSDRCGECNKPRDVCERTARWGDDTHEFRPDYIQPAGSAVDELRDIKHAAMAAKEES
ncbi:hypothetical protein [Nocardioides sp. YIM 152315]|uniref:hypothetical protein n=1 Tax=Nocardioides sp. YIM 152315 TaxID=3031760 RepID=UPI0023DC600E|nr:hypothetical protein [Nocardioides sp. YIM 152315]MDF1603377.1 hypothetical protein [Nocardioides sp. YIM 152315]